MQLTIIKDDSTVIKDGIAVIFDFSAHIDSNIHAIHFDTESEIGEIEFKNNMPNQLITDMDDFKAISDSYDVEYAAQNAPLPLLTLVQLKEHGAFLIDSNAGVARAKYITSSTGQAETYIMKGEQAQAYKDAGYPVDTATYPFVQVEADSYNATPQQAADMILATRDAWIIKAAEIEGIRRKGKVDLDSTTNTGDAQGIIDAAVAALELA